MAYLKNTAVKFEISEFTNPSGEIVFRVAGWLDGKRVRKNLATRVEAQAERQALEIAALQGESGMRVAATRLADDQLREAEAAFHRLEGRARSLAFYLDYALSNYRDPVNDMSLAEAAKLYLAVREADEKLGHISHRQFTAFRCDLPALSSLVVSDNSGLPGEGFIAASDVPKEQAAVFKRLWLDLTPPTEDQLANAAQRLPSNGRSLADLKAELKK